eukprot:snap_masked-scaffold_15-processed-gene-10.3-mRNA-1 protein AED:1.00 eAED:1.00 QI:0/-1/0/0/-1/1/1/0/59
MELINKVFLAIFAVFVQAFQVEAYGSGGLERSPGAVAEAMPFASLFLVAAVTLFLFFKN